MKQPYGTRLHLALKENNISVSELAHMLEYEADDMILKLINNDFNVAERYYIDKVLYIMSKD